MFLVHTPPHLDHCCSVIPVFVLFCYVNESLKHAVGCWQVCNSCLVTNVIVTVTCTKKCKLASTLLALRYHIYDGHFHCLTSIRYTRCLGS
jgi:hypothetical protein